MIKNDYEKVSDFYNKVYYQSVSLDENTGSHYLKLAKKINLATGESILDIACGTGKWLKAATDMGAIIHGVDISSEAIGICKQRFPNNVMEVGLAENLPFPDNYFDVVTCLGSLEHFLDQAKAIREMLRVAKPSARFLILVPNAGFLTYRLGLFKGTQQKEIKETIKSLEDWQNLFFEQGLSVKRRWADYHIMSKDWLLRRPYGMLIPRILQALLLLVWPLTWQYQVYHLLEIKQ